MWIRKCTIMLNWGVKVYEEKRTFSKTESESNNVEDLRYRIILVPKTFPMYATIIGKD